MFSVPFANDCPPERHGGKEPARLLATTVVPGQEPVSKRRQGLGERCQQWPVRHYVLQSGTQCHSPTGAAISAGGANRALPAVAPLFNLSGLAIRRSRTNLVRGGPQERLSLLL